MESATGIIYIVYYTDALMPCPHFAGATYLVVCRYSRYLPTVLPPTHRRLETRTALPGLAG
jgi:hypothetical protein